MASGRHRTDPIPFKPFDENGPVRIYYHGLLPHWRQEGCTYFVTFRLADSIPDNVLKVQEAERSQWLRARGIEPHSAGWMAELVKLPGSERRTFERFVADSVNRSLDECHGACVLRQPIIAKEVASALDYFHKQRVLTGDFVVMPNHVHVLLTPLPGFELEDILHSIKSFTAHKINKMLKQRGQLWQRESYDHIVRDFEQLNAFQCYTFANPAKAFLSESDYVYSSACYRSD